MSGDFSESEGRKEAEPVEAAREEGIETARA